MPDQSESSAPAITANPRVYCKGCGYALVGLPSSTCPECGRGFDLANRRTFARRPPRGWVWRWGRRVLAVVLLLVLAAGAGLFWLWRGWQGEQPTIARLRGLGQRVDLAPIGPPRLRWVLGERLGYLTERVDVAIVDGLGAAEVEQLDFRSLTHIQQLWLYNCELSNRTLNGLAGMAKLKHLALYYPRIQKPDLVLLEKLPALSTLYLNAVWFRSAGFEPIGRLVHLKALHLSFTGATDADLKHLRGLSSLEFLRIDGNRITDAGLEHLQGLKSLKRLIIDGRLVDTPGMAKLKQAIPGLEVTHY